MPDEPREPESIDPPTWRSVAPESVVRMMMTGPTANQTGKAAQEAAVVAATMSRTVSPKNMETFKQLAETQRSLHQTFTPSTLRAIDHVVKNQTNFDRLAKALAATPTPQLRPWLTAQTDPGPFQRLAEQIAADRSVQQDLADRAEQATESAREGLEAEAQAAADRIAREEAMLETITALHAIVIEAAQASASREEQSAAREARMLAMTETLTRLTKWLVVLGVCTIVVSAFAVWVSLSDTPKSAGSQAAHSTRGAASTSVRPMVAGP